MTIDERLDRLVERHEALTHSVELLRLSQAETDQKFKETEKRFEQIANLLVQTDGFVRSLADIAKRHAERLDALDGGDPI